MADTWAVDWAFKKLQGSTGVKKVEQVGELILSIERESKHPFFAGIIGSELITDSVISPLFQSTPIPQISVSIPKEAIWTGPAIDLARSNSSSFGGFGDLLRCLSVDDVGSYVNKEYEFIERVFRQHSNVMSFTRLYDRVYLIHRITGKDVCVALVNEYDVTAEHVRQARDRYGKFDAILKNNPNGGITREAKVAASAIGVSVFNLSQFLGRLNG